VEKPGILLPQLCYCVFRYVSEFEVGPCDGAQLPRACATVLTLRSPTRQRGVGRPAKMCQSCLQREVVSSRTPLPAQCEACEWGHLLGSARAELVAFRSCRRIMDSPSAEGGVTPQKADVVACWLCS
jgi:hypothetical protein